MLTNDFFSENCNDNNNDNNKTNCLARLKFNNIKYATQ